MKDIEIYSYSGTALGKTTIKAMSIQFAIDDFVALYPDDEIIFVHDLRYETITKQFYHESKVPTRG